MTIDVTHDPCSPLAISPVDASTTELAGIDAAIALWRNRGVSGLASTAPDARAIEMRFEVASPISHGFYDDEVGVIYINKDLAGTELLPIIIAHELGHAFGLPHIEPKDRASLMNPRNLTLPPTEGDQRALETLWGVCE